MAAIKVEDELYSDVEVDAYYLNKGDHANKSVKKGQKINLELDVKSMKISEGFASTLTRVQTSEGSKNNLNEQ